MKYIIIAVGAFMLASSAQANRSCPDGTVEMNGQCVVVDNGGGGNPGNTTATGGAGGNAAADATAGAIGVGMGTGGNATTGPIDVTTGPNTATGGAGGLGGAGGQGGSVGDTTATSGSASTATGGSVTGSGNSSSTSTAGVSGSGNSTNRTTVNSTNKTRIKHAASMAAPVMMGGYGPGNCFGDTNPSGQFGASIQTFGWGVSANRSKASNVCAAYAIAGPQGAVGYLAQQDPVFGKVARANGWVITKSQVAARSAAQGEPAEALKTVRCPAGSKWDGKGCWAANLKAVRR